jgi:hypothetical protein
METGIAAFTSSWVIPTSEWATALKVGRLRLVLGG